MTSPFIFSKKLLGLASSTLIASSLAFSAHAADELDGTSWRTINEDTHQAESVITFKKQGDGTYNGIVTKVLKEEPTGVCEECKGKYHKKSLQGAVIAKGLKANGPGKYSDGHIYDPVNDKTYSMKAEITKGGMALKVRGFLGVSLLGRSQEWQKAN